MAQPLFVGLDLDYTLLDTDEFFFGHTLPLLVRQFPDTINQSEFTAAMDTFRRAIGPANEYNFFAHIESLGLSSEVVTEAIVAELHQEEVLRPGAAEFISQQQALGHELHIITIGPEAYQQLKYRCIPQLQSIPITVIQQPKGAYIAQHLADKAGYMIDDKLLVDLPPSIRPLYITSRKSVSLVGDIYRNFDDLQHRGPTDLIRNL